MTVPENRIRTLAPGELRDGDFVLYWMTAFRRTHHSFALDRALELADEARKPLLILEGLRSGYEWASARLHRFVMDGMHDNAAACASAGVTYYPYLEPAPGMGKGMLLALARRAVAVVGDDFPSFFLPRMIRAAGDQLAVLGVRFEVVDANGIYPVRDTERVFGRAHGFRRHLQKRLPLFLHQVPRVEPLAGYELGPAEVPAEVHRRWPAAAVEAISPGADPVRVVPGLDASVEATLRGGSEAARERMARWFETGFPLYGSGRNHPDEDVASGLSPYLHFGHLSSHEVFAEVVRRESWTLDQIREKPNGSREGWWRMSETAESFLDELITWREVGYNFAALRPNDLRRYEALPEWAQQTLDEHRHDERVHRYSPDAFEAAATHDELWNAAQRELVTTGRMHNYLRMLWGKKILHWSASPEDAFQTMIHLNNKYALDGRNPNSYAGIGWVLGRYDRAWGPEREIFGKIRYMTSDSTMKKLRLKNYLSRYGKASSPQQAELTFR